MHRLFLHSVRSSEVLRDLCGAYFAGAQSALNNARAMAALLGEQGAEIGEDRSGWSLVVADEAGREVARIPVAMA